jgi:hypothetical protein
MLGYSQEETPLSSANTGTAQPEMDDTDMGVADYREMLVVL